MTLRLALRSLATRPVRSLVLAAGFGLGVAVMAGLLGVGEVILEQARSPALEGGGDLVVIGPAGVDSARFVTSQVLSAPPLAERVTAFSPTARATLYLVDGERPVAVRSRGGVPSLERALGDVETAGIAAWTDAPNDAAWAAPDPADVLRRLDRFHRVPQSTEFHAWWEWLYFNGRAGDTLFYVAFLAGPRVDAEQRRAAVGLHLQRGDELSSYGWSGTVEDAALLAGAPDLDFGPNRVRLDGLVYRIELDLQGKAAAERLRGRIELRAVPGRALPPLTLRAARGWLSGYVAPVLSGALEGELHAGPQRIELAGGKGYHDHNWGFWDGVSWQWGQVAGDGLSILYGRIRPPATVADPDRVPGFLLVLGPDGPLANSSNVTIEESGTAEHGAPARVVVTAGAAGNLVLDARVLRVIPNRGLFGESALRFLQLDADYHVHGRLGEREIDFRSRGAAETFRGDEEQ